MCPIHGYLARFMVLILTVLLVYGALLSVTGETALPGGNLFAIFVLFVCCSAAGWLTEKIHLPPLLGNKRQQSFEYACLIWAWRCKEEV